MISDSHSVWVSPLPCVCYIARPSHTRCNDHNDDINRRVYVTKLITYNFSMFHHRVHTGSGAHSASYPMVTGALSLAIKRPWREAYRSPASSADVKNAWSYTSTPPLRLHLVLRVKVKVVPLLN